MKQAFCEFLLCRFVAPSHHLVKHKVNFDQICLSILFNCMHSLIRQLKIYRQCLAAGEIKITMFQYLRQPMMCTVTVLICRKKTPPRQHKEKDKQTKVDKTQHLKLKTAKRTPPKIKFRLRYSESRSRSRSTCCTHRVARFNANPVISLIRYRSHSGKGYGTVATTLGTYLSPFCTFFSIQTVAHFSSVIRIVIIWQIQVAYIIHLLRLIYADRVFVRYIS